MLVLATLASLTLPGAPVFAQDRDLTWPEIAVTAHLDADGTLRVKERQVMRFTGDWNGGERRFDTRFGQEFFFDGMTRLDSIGTERALVEGDVDAVDHYDVMSGNAVRWRSRLPDGPVFNGTLLTYVLSFRYRNILDYDGDGGYTLNHDFAFSDRQGELTRFVLDLTLDSVWRAPSDFTGHYEAGPLPAYEGYTVRVPLTYAGRGLPTAVRTGASFAVRSRLQSFVGLACMLILVWYIRSGAKRGVSTHEMLQSAITQAWLEEHVFAYPAEVLGAAYDGRVGEQEVAATLARMVQEQKLASRVTTRPSLFNKHVLHLTLKVDRDSLDGYEAALVHALFTPGSDHTDTESVKERYSDTGFNPASVIKAGVLNRVRALAPEVGTRDRRAAFRARLGVTVALGVVAVALLGAAFSKSATDGGVALMIMVIALGELFVGTLLGLALRDRVTGFQPPLVLVSFFQIELMVVMFWLLNGNQWLLGPAALAAIAEWAVMILHAIASAACTTLSAEQVALRKQLSAVRRWFATELEKREPQLKDAWYPYMLALGLGKHVDKWFKAFGGTATSDTTHFSSSSATSSSSSSSGSGSSGFTGFGGGGGFSGGGGGSTWGAALGSMASTVSSPSTSSSGSSSSSSSSSSSGGGGGGGW